MFLILKVFVFIFFYITEWGRHMQYVIISNPQAIRLTPEMLPPALLLIL